MREIGPRKGKGVTVREGFLDRARHKRLEVESRWPRWRAELVLTMCLFTSF
jgi:hypothetical protein